MDSDSSLAAYLTDGRVAVTFKPTSELAVVTATSNNKYNDSMRYHVSIVFDEGEVSLTVNETDVASVNSKPNNVFLTVSCIHNFDFFIAFIHTYSQSPIIWIGGTNVTFPNDFPTESYISLQGCLYNIGFTNNGLLKFLNTSKALVIK